MISSTEGLLPTALNQPSIVHRSSGSCFAKYMQIGVFGKGHRRGDPLWSPCV